jgi:hypothetical protein
MLIILDVTGLCLSIKPAEYLKDFEGYVKSTLEGDSEIMVMNYHNVIWFFQQGNDEA